MKRNLLGKFFAVVMTVALVLSLMIPVTSNALIYESENGYCWYYDDESDLAALFQGYNGSALALTSETVDDVDCLCFHITASDPYVAWAVGETDISKCHYAVMYANYITENANYSGYAQASFRIQAQDSEKGKMFWTMNWGLNFKANVWEKYILDLSDPNGADMQFYDNISNSADWHEVYYEGMSIIEIRTTLCNSGSPQSFNDEVCIKCIAFFETMEAAESFSPFADYTAVDEAIATVPEDLSSYNDTTKTALEKAVNAVIRGLSSFDQETVDAYAQRITAAVAALSTEPDPTEVPTAAPTEAPTEAPKATTAPKADDNAESSEDGLGTGAIIGIIAAAVVVIAVVVIIVLKKKKA